MSKYVSVFLLPVPKKNLTAYVKLARASGKLFCEHGALGYSEYLSSDSGPYGALVLSGRLKPRKGEVLIYSTIEFKSEKHRDQVTKKAMGDPRFEKLMPKPPLWDYRRMGFGGFKLLVDVK